MDPKEPTCITCGLATGEAPRLNRLDNGAVCPTCRDRLLDLLPPLFPGGERLAAGPGADAPAEEEEGVEGRGAAQGAGKPKLVPVRGPRSTRSRSKRG